MADLDRFLARFFTASIVGQRVRAKAEIKQSPCAEEDDGSPSPDVPAGTVGTVEDVDTADEDCVEIFVDFGAPYGPVLCDPDELEYAK